MSYYSVSGSADGVTARFVCDLNPSQGGTVVLNLGPDLSVHLSPADAVTLGVSLTVANDEAKS